MAQKIVTRLAAKHGEFATASEAALDEADYLEGRVSTLRAQSESDATKAAAVTKALGILKDAGVEV